MCTFSNLLYERSKVSASSIAVCLLFEVTLLITYPRRRKGSASGKKGTYEFWNGAQQMIHYGSKEQHATWSTKGVPFRRKSAVSKVSSRRTYMSSDGDPRRLYVCRSNVFGPRRSTAAAVAPRPRLTLMGVLWQRVETPSTGSSRAGKDAVGGAVACVVGKRQVHPALGTHVAQIRAGLPSVCSCNLCNQKKTRISLPHGFRGKQKVSSLPHTIAVHTIGRDGKGGTENLNENM